MKIFEPLFINVIEELLSHQVEFLMIGGYAVNYYGYGRYTGDIDFWLKPDNNNRDKFIKALLKLKPDSEILHKISLLDFTKAQVISIGEPPLRVDFLTRVNLVNFDDAWQKKRMLPLNNMQLPVVDYDHLITMKFNTGRAKDKIDLDVLQRINRKKAD